MFNTILDALMAVLWIGSLVGCYVVAVLMRPRSKADSEGKADDNADRGEEGGADEPPSNADATRAKQESRTGTATKLDGSTFKSTDSGLIGAQREPRPTTIS